MFMKYSGKAADTAKLIFFREFIASDAVLCFPDFYVLLLLGDKSNEEYHIFTSWKSKKVNNKQGSYMDEMREIQDYDFFPLVQGNPITRSITSDRMRANPYVNPLFYAC